MKKYGSERILLDGSLQYKTVILETTDRQLFLLFIIIDIFVDRCTTANWANLLIPSSSSDSIFWCDFGVWGSSKLPIQQQRNKINPKSPVFFRSCVAFLYDRVFSSKNSLMRILSSIPLHHSSTVANCKKGKAKLHRERQLQKPHEKKLFPNKQTKLPKYELWFSFEGERNKKRKKISWCMWKLALNIRHGSIWIFHFEI